MFGMLVALDVSKAFYRVWHADLLHKLKSHGISGQIFGLFLLFSVIGCFKWFWMGRFHKSIQLILEFFKGPLLVLHFSYYILITFLMMLCHITNYCDDTTLLSGICSVATTRISL